MWALYKAERERGRVLQDDGGNTEQSSAMHCNAHCAHSKESRFVWLYHCHDHFLVGHYDYNLIYSDHICINLIGALVMTLETELMHGPSNGTNTMMSSHLLALCKVPPTLFTLCCVLSYPTDQSTWKCAPHYTKDASSSSLICLCSTSHLILSLSCQMYP